MSPEKTKLIFFYQRKPLQSPVTINGTPIGIVTENTYLGMIIDSRLSFRTHISIMTDNLQARLNLFSILTGISKCSHPTTLKKLYNGIISGYIQYGSAIYQNAAKTNLKKLNTLINSALRKVNGLTGSTPLNSVYTIAAEPPREIKAESQCLKKILKTKMNNTAVYKTMLKI